VHSRIAIDPISATLGLGPMFFGVTHRSPIGAYMEELQHAHEADTIVLGDVETVRKKRGVRLPVQTGLPEGSIHGFKRWAAGFTVHRGGDLVGRGVVATYLYCADYAVLPLPTITVHSFGESASPWPVSEPAISMVLEKLHCCVVTL
jgi:hypothetical protein